MIEWDQRKVSLGSRSVSLFVDDHLGGNYGDLFDVQNACGHEEKWVGNRMDNPILERHDVGIYPRMIHDIHHCCSYTWDSSTLLLDNWTTRLVVASF